MNTQRCKLGPGFLAVAGMLFLTATVWGQQKNPSAQAPVVTLDIFSGRPNPTWTLTPVQVSDLEGRIAKLAPSGKIDECPQNLGYRGFIVQWVDAKSNPVRTVNACLGAIRVKTATESKSFIDPQRKIELWLLESSSVQPPLTTDLIDMVVKEIRSKAPSQ
jgi:hypothetical protein